MDGEVRILVDRLGASPYINVQEHWVWVNGCRGVRLDSATTSAKFSAGPVEAGREAAATRATTRARTGHP